MAKVSTPNYSPTENAFFDSVNKFAEQYIYGVESADEFESDFPTVEVDTGTDIELSVFEAAKKQAFDPTGAQIFANNEPDEHSEYFLATDWEHETFPVTWRRDEARKVALSGAKAEDIAAKVIDTTTQGEGYWTFDETLNLFKNETFFKDYSAIAGRAPTNMKGVLYMLRDMYNHAIGKNSDMSNVTYESKVRPEDVRVVVPYSLLNLIDVKELAEVFNKENIDILGKIVKLDDSANPSMKYTAFVLDRKAVRRFRRLYELGMDKNDSGRFINYTLHSERLFGLCNLFKAAKIDCTAAADSALAEITEATQA